VKPVILRPRALEDLSEAVAWYAARDPKVAKAFIGEVAEMITRIGENAAQFPAWPDDPTYRKATLPETFPYALFFREGAQQTRILAVVHGAQKPGAWLRRRRPPPR
jgi:plasmid stabilization system protein ParE